MTYINEVDRWAAKLAGNAVIRSVRKGMLYMIPLTLIGSFALMLLNLPIAAFQAGMGYLFGDYWRSAALFVYNGTFQIMSVTALLSVSYCYAAEKQPVQSGEISQLSVVLTAIASYIAYCGAADTVIDFPQSSSTGLFRALILAILSTELFLRLSTVRRMHTKILSNDIDAVLRSSLHVTIPALCTIVCVGILRTLFHYLGLTQMTTGAFDSAMSLLAHSDAGLLTTFVFIITSHLLWFFGFHGTNLLDGVAKELFVTASTVNMELIAAGQAPTEILTKQFLDVFVFMGGCGTTIGLLFANAIAGRKRLSRLERYSFFPALFNINELLVYGIPIIYNPYLLIPFLFAPVLLSLVSYGALWLGLVPLTTTSVTWTTPILISGYISTGSLSGTILQIVNLFLSIGVYLPFVRMYANHQSKNSVAAIQTLGKEIQYIQESRPKAILNRQDEVGIHARCLAEDLAACLRGEADFLHLEYQPKVSFTGQVVGAEALLRCNHPVYGFVSPPIVITVAEEAGHTVELGRWVLRRAIDDMRKLNQDGFPSLCVSVNISPQQLKEDGNLSATVMEYLKLAQIPPSLLELELTENAAIDQSARTQGKLDQLKQAGIAISIDDFGMGHSSLLYLRDFYANVVKIDMSLVSSIAEDPQSEKIISSICDLCKQLQVSTVAEGVETRQQLEKLRELGCETYQGYLFSKALPLPQFEDYLNTHGCGK